MSFNDESSQKLNLGMDFVRSFPGIVVVKDASFRYSSLSQTAANYLGWGSCEQAIGKGCHDAPSRISELAPLFISEDEKLLKTRKKILTLCIGEYSSGWKCLLNEAILIKDETRKFENVFVTSLDLTSVSLLHYYSKFPSLSFEKKQRHLVIL